MKKTVQEKWEGFKKKFESTKSEMSQEVLNAKTPDDMIATGKKLQEQGEVLKAEEEGVKQEEMDEAHGEAIAENAKFDKRKAEEKMEAEHSEAIEMNKNFDEAKLAEEKAKESAKIAEEARLSAEADAIKAAELLEKIKSGNLETASVEKEDAVKVENTESVKRESVAEEINTEELVKKYLWNGEAGYISGKLSRVPESVRSNKEFMMEAITGSKDPGNVIEYAGENLKNDKEFALYAMSVNETNSHSESVYEKLSPELQNDREIVMGAIKAHTSLDKFKDQFKRDKEIVLAALQDSRSHLIKTIPSELLSDREVAFAALKNQMGKNCIGEFPENYQNDKEFVLAAIKEQPYNYLGASSELKSDPEIAFEAIKIDLERNRGYGGLVGELDYALKGNKDFMKKITDLQKELRKKEEDRRDAAWKASQQKSKK